ncbi:MAG TPA: ABC transporter substrate-binding protein [Acidimicrobiales bacterium]|nr:ABC transporter substrate-binding protein [Acidimicrobiales bacterium]
MRRRTTLMKLLSLLTVFAFVAAGCGDDDEPSTDAGQSGESTTTAADGSTTTEAPPAATAPASDRGNVDNVLKLGTLLPESGDLAAIVESLRTPIDLAIEEINAGGGVFGQDVVTASADDGTDPQRASNGFDRLSESDKVDVILGPAGSSVVVGVFDKIAAAGIPTCSGSATSYELTQLQQDGDDGGYFLRTAPPDTLQGPALADLVTSDGNTSVSLIVRNDSYGTGFADSLESRFASNGVDVDETVAYNPDAGSFDTEAQTIADAGSDAVVLIGFPDDGGKVLSALITAGAGPADLALYTADGLQSGELYTKVDAEDPSVVEGIRGTAPSSAPGGVESPFIATYEETGVDPIFSSYYYDCTMILALAAEAAGTDEGDKIVAEVADVVAGGEKCDSWASCKELLDAGEDFDYDGASGALDFNGLLEPTAGVYDVWAFDAEGGVATEDAETQIAISEEDL